MSLYEELARDWYGGPLVMTNGGFIGPTTMIDKPGVQTIEAIQSLGPARARYPLQDEETKAWLRQHGFNLDKPISWWDTDTDCRHFVQTTR